MQRLEKQMLEPYMLHGFEIATHGNEMIFNIEINNHYEKFHPPKPHYLAPKTQKTTHVQLLCSYSLGIRTIV
jgi:hypothetical protein